jgi:hypothetical protein
MEPLTTKRRSRPAKVAASIQDLTMRDLDALAVELTELDPRIATMLRDSLGRSVTEYEDRMLAERAAS